ncbi:MAG: ATP-binding protein, partial [Duncaniella sp.]|nr:ATP-binding protein [Duncaniella sp.]
MADDITELITDDDAAVLDVNGSENYTEDDIKTLSWNEHIRERPGMYIGNLGDGSYGDDGIYVLVKEVLDNSVDEYMMGFGKTITIEVDDTTVTVRDNGRGIPLGKLVDATSRMNTGGKYDGKAFKKSVGLNGVGIKAVNALSSRMEVTSFRDGKMKTVVYSGGNILDETPIEDSDEPSGTMVKFTPDASIFRNYRFRMEFIIPLVKKYTYLNSGMAIMLNGQRYISRNGLLDLLRDSLTMDPLYEPIHLTGEDIEVAFT